MTRLELKHYSECNKRVQRHLSLTFAPSFANAIAVDFPIPFDPPVTKATFPTSFPSIAALLSAGLCSVQVSGWRVSNVSDGKEVGARDTRKWIFFFLFCFFEMGMSSVYDDVIHQSKKKI